jgi:hypothetical protein
MPATKIERMKALWMVFFSVISLAICAQEVKTESDGHQWEAAYALPVPEGWTTERFPIPISFAPEIPYTGIEDIRFSPGWAKAQSDSYWSYAFLWYLEGDVRMDPETMGRNLKAYYAGLIAVNGSRIPPEKMIPVETSFEEVKTGPGDFKTYAGTIGMLDYMSQKPMVLHCMVHVKSCPGSNRTFIFFELSPKPYSDEIWQDLHRIWLNFSCKKS